MARNKPIEFEFTADVAKYLSEVKKMSVTTEDVEDAFVAVTQSSEDMERKLSRAVKDAASDVEVLERAIKDLPDATDRMADQAVRDFDRVGDAAGETGREAGQEFQSNLGESLQSGDMEGLVAGTLGGLVAGMEGAAGLAFSALAGVALVAFTQIKKSWEEMQAAITEQAASMWSSSLDAIGDKVGEIGIQVTNTYLAQKELDRLWQEAPDEMQKLVEAAEDLNINAHDLIMARAGDEQALGRVKTAMDNVYETQNATGEATVDQIKAVQDVEDAVYKAGGALDLNNAKVTAHNDSLEYAAELSKRLTDEVDKWGPGIKKSEDQLNLLIKAFEENPLNMDVRLNLDASQLRQLAPYGTLATGTYDPATWKNPYGTKPRTA
jgi:hypothetical protein